MEQDKHDGRLSKLFFRKICIAFAVLLNNWIIQMVH